jgi:hypothetical protein
VFCRNCGTQLSDDASFCSKCGLSLLGDQRQAVTARQLPGVACQHPGCQSPVIGQCSGYRGSCAEHSVESFCDICVQKAAHDAAAKALYDDYLGTCQKLPKLGCGTWVTVITLLIALFVGGAALLDSGGVLPSVGGVLLLALGLFATWVIIASLRGHSAAVAKIAAEKPGFAEFYNEYRKQKNSESMATTLAALLAVGAAANAVQQYQVRQDIHAIAKKLKNA